VIPNVLPFPVRIVSAGNLRADIIAGARGERWASIPAFTRNVTPAGTVVPVYEDDENGEPMVVGSRILAAERVDIGMIRRQCTADYKVVPIRRKVRKLLGIAGRRSPTRPVAEQWIGISRDETVRVKPSFEHWQINRWPLIEQGVTRLDCLRWLERHGYPQPPKSACIGCPFHSDDHWRRMRARDPDVWGGCRVGRSCRPDGVPGHFRRGLSSSFCRAAGPDRSLGGRRSRPAPTSGRTNAMGYAACDTGRRE
jgi:hypothetical protein